MTLGLKPDPADPLEAKPSAPPPLPPQTQIKPTWHVPDVAGQSMNPLNRLPAGVLKNEIVNIAHRTNAEISGQFTMAVKHLSLLERMKSAFIYLLAWWLAGVACVLVPVLHFVLVPLAALGGIGAFFYRLRLKEFRLDTVIECPACKAKLELKKAAFNWPLRETCNECRAAFNITENF